MSDQVELCEAPPVDLSIFPLPPVEQWKDLARWEGETMAQFCKKTARAMYEGALENHGWCTYPAWKIERAMLEKVKENECA